MTLNNIVTFFRLAEGSKEMDIKSESKIEASDKWEGGLDKNFYLRDHRRN